MVSTDDPGVVLERADGVGEIETALRETGIALGVVPLESRGIMCVDDLPMSTALGLALLAHESDFEML